MSWYDECGVRSGGVEMTCGEKTWQEWNDKMVYAVLGTTIHNNIHPVTIGLFG